MNHFITDQQRKNDMKHWLKKQENILTNFFLEKVMLLFKIKTITLIKLRKF